MTPEYAALLRERFPNTAHGLTGPEFVRLWQGVQHHFAGQHTRMDAVAGWPGRMDFSGALMATKAGLHVARESWGGRHSTSPHGPCEGRYVAMQLGYPDGIDVNKNTAEATGLPLGSRAAFTPYLIHCTPPGPRPRIFGGGYPENAPLFGMWTPSAEDVMAEDWMVVCRPDDKPSEPEDLAVTVDDLTRPVRPGEA